MWLKLYTWLTKRFGRNLELADYRIHALDIDKHVDFQNFLEQHISLLEVRKIIIKSINEARQTDSYEPLEKL